MNDFKVVELLYKGDVSDIWQGVHLASNTEVHVVTVNKKVNQNIFDHKRMQELESLVSQLNHPHLLRYHKIVQNENTIGIIMEHPKGGCLRDHLLRRPDKKLSENEARTCFKQIVSAVEYVHKFNVVYRNLNLRNIFIDRNNQIKVGDLLVCFKVGPIYKPSNVTSSCHFYAPEIWLDDGSKIELSADIWSLGVLLYVMTCGCYPFDGKNEFDIYLSVKKAQFAIPSSLSDECASLIKMILQSDPALRPTIAQIKVHPWFMGPQGPPRPALPRQFSASALRGGLGAIQEDPNEEEPASPVIQGIRDLSLGTNTPPAQPRQLNVTGFSTETFPILSHIPFSAQLEEQPRATEEQAVVKAGTRKRPSVDEDAQKLINSYRNRRQEAHNQSVSSLISNAGISQHVPLTLSPSFVQDFTNDAPLRRETKRRSSDSIIHNEEVMRMLGLAHLTVPIEQDLPQANFSVPTPPAAAESRGRHNRTGSTGEDNNNRPARKVGVSPGPRKVTARRRRNSVDTNLHLQQNHSSGSTVQDFFSNIQLLPQTGSEQRGISGLDPFGTSNNPLLNNFQVRQQQNVKQQQDFDLTQQNLQNLLSQNGLNFDPYPGEQPRSLTQQLIDPQMQIPFMDPELQKQIDNLQTDLDAFPKQMDTLQTPDLDPDYLTLLEAPEQSNLSVDYLIYS
jgi:serine/threonine protein kinase